MCHGGSQRRLGDKMLVRRIEVLMRRNQYALARAVLSLLPIAALSISCDTPDSSPTVAPPLAARPAGRAEPDEPGDDRAGAIDLPIRYVRRRDVLDRHVANARSDSNVGEPTTGACRWAQGRCRRPAA